MIDQKRGYYLQFRNEDVIKYFREIGSHNPKNNLKFNHWIGSRRVPSNKELLLG